MKKKKGVLDGRYTSDPFASKCSCGEKVHFMRKGNMRVLPGGHKCKYVDAQKAEMRTIRAEESAGINVTPSEATRRVNGALRW
jgi:hypothetical protein